MTAKGAGDPAAERLLPSDPARMRRFLDTFLYEEGAFMFDEVLEMDAEAGTIGAVLDTKRLLPLSALQRVDARHPAHVSAAELLMVTGSLGCMHAWFFHDCHWDEGWVGFGSRIHRADFKNLARIGPPLRLESRETKVRVGARRVMLRYEFHFWQGDKIAYRGDQSALFVKEAWVRFGEDRA